MKYDAFKEHQKLYLFGLICLFLSVCLIIFSIYILPFLIWDTNYGVPSFLTDQIANLQDNYEYTTSGAKWIVELIFLIPGIITGFISYVLSNYIDKQNVDFNPELLENEEGEEGGTEKEREVQKKMIKREIKDTASFGLKILGLIILVIIIILIVQAILF